MANYTRTRPSFEGASLGKNPRELLLSLEYLHNRVSDLEAKTGGSSIDLTKSIPVSTPPPPAQIQVQTLPGKFIVQLSNPTIKNNAQISNVLEFSDDPTFSKVKTIPIGTQKYVEIGQFGVGASKYVRVKSSLDGTNFSTPRSAGLHST